MAHTYGIGLYAPAGFATEPAAVDRAVARLEALGHRVVVDATCTARWQRFCGNRRRAARGGVADGG